MSDFGFKVKKLRKNKGLNQDELAQILAVGKTTISNYETGYTTPSNTNIRQLADFFGVEVNDLLDDKISIDHLLGNIPPKQTTTLSEPSAASFREKAVPVYLSLAAADQPLVPIHQLKFSTSFIGEGEIFGLKVSGDRMDRAALPDGSIALIRRQDFADDGEVIVVSLEDNPAFFCRYFRQGELVVLENESSNPVYRPVIVNPREQSFKIHGKVIKSIHSVF